MKKNTLYTYLGTNGVLTTPIHLEDIYYTTSYQLIADNGKMLTDDGGKTFHQRVVVPVEEIDNWKEAKMMAKAK